MENFTGSVALVALDSGENVSATCLCFASAILVTYCNVMFCKLFVCVFSGHTCFAMYYSKVTEYSRSGHGGKINEIQMLPGLIINLKQGDFYCHL